MGKLLDLDAFDFGQIVRRHRDWSVDRWKRVAWSDESRFRLLNANGRLRVWGQALEIMDPARQVGTVQGMVAQSCYPHGNGVFQKDNCTSHKSRLATGWLDEHSSDFSVINWPPRSQDLNPIEHLWDVLEQGMKCHHTAPNTMLIYGQL
ncbi:transposable element Tc1 transposase [Trichonephila clavipes]|nr:transposable element Tc1 transposase [Trichonephila clavipes]